MTTACRGDIDEIFFEASSVQEFANDEERSIFHWRWLGRYLSDEPQHAFVALRSDRRACGYVVGSLTDPAPRAEFSHLGYFVDFARLTRNLSSPSAHQCCPRLPQSADWRSACRCFRPSRSGNADAPGLHVVTGEGMRNVGFYERLGFACNRDVTPWRSATCRVARSEDLNAERSEHVWAASPIGYQVLFRRPTGRSGERHFTSSGRMLPSGGHSAVFIPLCCNSCEHQLRPDNSGNMIETSNLGALFDPENGGNKIALVDCSDWDHPISLTTSRNRCGGKCLRTGLVATRAGARRRSGAIVCKQVRVSHWLSRHSARWPCRRSIQSQVCTRHHGVRLRRLRCPSRPV